MIKYESFVVYVNHLKHTMIIRALHVYGATLLLGCAGMTGKKIMHIISLENWNVNKLKPTIDH